MTFLRQLKKCGLNIIKVVYCNNKHIRMMWWKTNLTNSMARVNSLSRYDWFCSMQLKCLYSEFVFSDSGILNEVYTQLLYVDVSFCVDYNKHGNFISCLRKITSNYKLNAQIIYTCHKHAQRVKVVYSLATQKSRLRMHQLYPHLQVAKTSFLLFN